MADNIAFHGKRHRKTRAETELSHGLLVVMDDLSSDGF